MTLKDLIDIEGLKSHILEIGVRAAITQAKDMAYDLASTDASKHGVYSIYCIYNELSEAELDAERGIMAIGAILDKLTTEEEKHRFCSYSYPELKI